MKCHEAETEALTLALAALATSAEHKLNSARSLGDVNAEFYSAVRDVAKHLLTVLNRE